MPDRVIRDELLDSGRWLDLPVDTERLAFFGFLLRRIDDFGNMEGGLRGIFRFLHSFTQVKTEESAAVVLTHLCDADLLRHYKVDGREFYHLPRFRPHRQYLVRKQPASPWDNERKLGKSRRVELRGLAKEQGLGENIATTSHARSMHVAEGVGVGVGVGELQHHRASTRVAAHVFAQFWAAYPKKKNKGQAEKAWAKIKPDEAMAATMLKALERAKASADWTKDAGRYIPHPATWLNAKGWEDEDAPLNWGQEV